MKENGTFEKRIRKSYRTLIVISAAIFIIGIVAFYFGGPKEELSLPSDDIDHAIAAPSIDSKTGLVKDKGMTEVINNCTNCHAAELVTQNRMSREGWLSTIRWMQESQNLWQLGATEEIILDYLEKHYAPEVKGRRAPLKDIDWYVLKE